MTSSTQAIELPSKWLTASEPVRAALDWWCMWLRLPELLVAPRGDGHAVLVLPGFATSDHMTEVLRRYLQYLGYDSHPWKLGLNTGFKALGKNSAALKTRLTEAYERHNRKVTLVGWSLGGIMSRRLAREHPHMVRQVISLGSPFTGNPEAVAIKRMYERVSGEVICSPQAGARFARDRVAPNVPTVAIWSRADGITNWRNCREDEADHVRNIEVRGSHLGLTHNAQVLLTIAHLLAEKSPERDDKQIGTCAPFKRTSPVELLAGFGQPTSLAFNLLGLKGPA